MAVSSSHGGDFKIWVCNHGIQQKDQMLQNSGWTCHAVGSYKKKPMTAATFSADGSILVVAAENVITVWDPEKNVLVAVTGENFEPITSLSFVGKSEYLVSISKGSKPQLSVWSMSKLSVSWSYKLHTEALASTGDVSSFAVLALLPKPSKGMKSDDTTLQGRDGVILLFNVADPVPVATWSVRKAKGGGLAFLAFLNVNPSSSEENNASDGKPSPVLLAYINGDHEYVIFDPFGKETHEVSVTRRASHVGHEETGKFGYASIYGELPEFAQKRSHASGVPFVPSERPWETIFTGSSHNLPPLTKLCSVFLESLLEKRTAIVE
ncbi:hypothetical protein L1049_028484 [Liquidambar formosana]|uniref:WD repeat-containing protein 75 second beta-propeller domain-containing protein n=1 Tax=Liquidambar formosana TaxID=63359 RepID=A0AAP0WWL8_LIQFO